MITLLSIPMSLFAQDPPIDLLIKKYGGEDGFTTVVISGEMFSLFSTVDSAGENADINKLMKSLSSIKIVNIDKSKYKDSKLEFYTQLMKDLPKEKYLELMTVKEKDQNVKFFIRKLETGRIGEMIMVSTGDDDNTLISISGQIDLNDMSKLSKTLGIQGLENLKELEGYDEDLAKTKRELEKTKQELEMQRIELEKQKKELERQMKELEEEKRK